jgi:hypothetical protein
LIYTDNHRKSFAALRSSEEQRRFCVQAACTLARDFGDAWIGHSLKSFLARPPYFSSPEVISGSNDSDE